MEQERLAAHSIRFLISLRVAHYEKRLTLKGEACAKLVASFVQLLGIKRAANAESQTAVDLGVVSKGGDAGVVDLSLQRINHEFT